MLGKHFTLHVRQYGQRGRCSLDRLIVGFPTTSATSAYHQ